MTPTSLELIFRPETEAQQQALLQLAAAWLKLGSEPKADSPPSTPTPINTAATEVVAITTAPTLQDVRTRLTELSRAGKAAAVKALLKQHGANSLTELNPADYAAVLAAGGAL